MNRYDHDEREEDAGHGDGLLAMDEAATVPNLEARLDRFYTTAAAKIDELRAERDSARAHWAMLQKAIDDADLCQLLDDVLEFVRDQADADGDCNGFTPNTAMRLQMAAEKALCAFGWEA